jgi:hypothetical protein
MKSPAWFIRSPLSRTRAQARRGFLLPTCLTSLYVEQHLRLKAAVLDPLPWLKQGGFKMDRELSSRLGLCFMP